MEIKDFEKLITLFQQSDMTRLKYKNGEENIVLEKGLKDFSTPYIQSMKVYEQSLPESSSGFQKTISQLPPTSGSATSSFSTVADVTPDNLQYITAPLVGTLYRSSSPDKPPFVKVGDKVKKGDILCIIEAMKLMNEIEADRDCEIAAILVENANSVEFGTKIFGIKPI